MYAEAQSSSAHGRGAGALERRREGEHQLQDFVEGEARDLSGEPFTRFMTQLYKRIYGLIARWGCHACRAFSLCMQWPLRVGVPLLQCGSVRAPGRRAGHR